MSENVGRDVQNVPIKGKKTILHCSEFMNITVLHSLVIMKAFYGTKDPPHMMGKRHTYFVIMIPTHQAL